MVYRKMRLAAAGILFGLLILTYISVSGTFIALLLGFLFIPPVLVTAWVFREGMPVIAEELRDLLHSGKEFLVVSISRESITLEPQVR